MLTIWTLSFMCLSLSLIFIACDDSQSLQNEFKIVDSAMYCNPSEDRALPSKISLARKFPPSVQYLEPVCPTPTACGLLGTDWLFMVFWALNECYFFRLQKNILPQRFEPRTSTLSKLRSTNRTPAAMIGIIEIPNVQQTIRSTLCLVQPID